MTTPPAPRPLLLVLSWCALTAVLAPACLALQPLLGPDPDLLSLVMLAPAIATGLLWIGVRRWFPAPPSRVSTGRLAADAGASLVVVAVIWVTFALVTGSPGVLPSTVAGLPVGVLVAAQTLGALAEEIGYKGLFFRCLEVSVPRWATVVVVGLLFGLSHLQYLGDGPWPVLLFLVSCVLLTETITLLWSGDGAQRMVPATIVHTGVNLAIFACAGSTVSTRVFAGMAVATAAGAATALALRAVRRAPRPAPHAHTHASV